MSADHKASLARGRTNGRIVKTYLDLLEATKPRRGRKPSTESLKKHLEDVKRELSGADSLQRLQLNQRRKDLEARMAETDVEIDRSAAEAQFVEVARAYGEVKGIAYSTWRDVGVPIDVLNRAGIGRGEKG